MQKRNILETLLAKFPEDTDEVLDYVEQFDEDIVYPIDEIDVQEAFNEHMIQQIA